VNRRNLLPLAGILLVAGSLAVQVAAAASPRPEPLRREFKESLEVVQVEVPVQVIDRDGQPVRGLNAADFSVFDEGRRREIVQFETVDLDTVALTSPGTWPAGLPLSARRHLLFLFDLSFSTPTSILRARLAAREFALRSMGPADLAAVVAYSVELGPRLVMSFTPDRAQLARAIDTLSSNPQMSVRATVDPLGFMLGHDAGLTGEALSEGSSAQSGKGAMGLEEMAHAKAMADRLDKDYNRSRIKIMTEGLAQLARSLDTVRGRKQVVLFSEGFDSRLLLGRNPTGSAEEQTENFNAATGALWLVDNDNRYGNTELLGNVEQMLEAFRRANCAIQAVDIGGLRAGGDATGSVRGPGQDSLFLLANETGGTLFRNGNDLGEQLQRVLDRSAFSYVLTIAAEHLASDGKYRRLRVELAKTVRGATLSYRRGYYAPRSFAELPAIERTLLAADAIASAQPRHDIEVHLLAAAFRGAPNRAYVPVIVEAEGPDLGGEQSGRTPLELYSYVTDQRGEMRDYFARVFTIDRGASGGRAAGGGLKYYGHFDLAPGRYLLRVLVRNSENGHAGVATARLEVPDFALEKTAALPPFALEAPGRWLMVRELPPGGKDTGSVVYPFTVNGEPFVPSASPTLRRGESQRFCWVVYNAPPGSLQLMARLVDEGGHEVPGGRLESVERTATGIPRLDKWLASLAVSELPRGEYTLEVWLAAPDAGEVVRSTTSVVVRD